MLTLVVATFNGEKTLPRMLESLCVVRPPEGGYELIVIDNGSTDATPTILADFRARLPLRVLEQPHRGKNRALNLALPEVRGDLAVFTDDDVIPEPGWLRALEAAAGKHPECDIFGGAIRLLWPRTPPDWIMKNVEMGTVYGRTSPALTDREVPPDLIWGGNMMLRSRLFREGARFDEAVGPSAGHYVMGGETSLTVRLHKAGATCRFVPDAMVSHIIDESQLQLEWLLARAMRLGKSEYRQHALHGTMRYPTLLGHTRWVARRALTSFLLALLSGWKLNPKHSYRHLWDLYLSLGYILHEREMNSRHGPH